jgi:hypothetical protein
MDISLALPGGGFVDDLSGQNAELGFVQIEPTVVPKGVSPPKSVGRVMPFEALDQPFRFGDGAPCCGY